MHVLYCMYCIVLYCGDSVVVIVVVWLARLNKDVRTGFFLIFF